MAGDSKYDPKSDPDYGKDLWNLVPQLSVPAPWNGDPGPPSFNNDPPPGDPGSGDPAVPPVTPVSPISVNLTSLRGSEMNMISEVQSLVADYQALRDDVWATKDTVFGQNAMVHGTAISNPAGGGAPSGGNEKPSPSPIQGPAHEFANSLNPAQERVLEQIANSIEIVGQFVAGLNKAGQTYGAADRKAKFPEPPSSPVT
jgi:hypothetical protein